MKMRSKFRGQSEFKHGRQPGMGVLVVNLGTPDEPTTPSVRRYLAEFLSDGRVVEIPKLLWLMILHGIILRIRPAKSAKAYQSVWSDKGSPLMATSSDLTDKIKEKIQSKISGKCNVELAMRYGEPSIQKGLERLEAQGAERIMVLQLYPQYSSATTGTVCDAVFKNLLKWRWVPELRMLGTYHDAPEYIYAISNTIREHWLKQGLQDGDALQPGSKLFISFHGMPKATLLAGDPYFCHCHKTARLIADNLGLESEQWEMAFQSRFGKAEWLQPYVAKRIVELPAEGVKNITVICPGFAVDCLETLEEIAMEGRNDFLAAGGEQFEYIPCLNASEEHVTMMVNKIIDNASGWLELKDENTLKKASEDLEKGKVYAMTAGGN